jgi:hypothetical protein
MRAGKFAEFILLFAHNRNQADMGLKSQFDPMKH